MWSVSQPGERATWAGDTGAATLDGNVFEQRQRGRTDAIFGWLGEELSAGDFGLPPLSVIWATRRAEG